MSALNILVRIWCWMPGIDAFANYGIEKDGAMKGGDGIWDCQPKEGYL
jgi:hypothetical protein